VQESEIARSRECPQRAKNRRQVKNAKKNKNVKNEMLNRREKAFQDFITLD
jgi:hypothetical protein